MNNKQERDALSRKRYREKHAQQVKERNAAYYQANKDKISQYNADHYKKNGDKYKDIRLESSKRYYQENREQMLEYHRTNPKNSTYRKRYRTNNPHKIAALSSKRRAQCTRATPPWADMHVIDLVYRKRDELTKLWGIDLEVDHIVPLRSTKVCGLHCEANLQLIEWSDNRRKSNSWWCEQ